MSNKDIYERVFQFAANIIVPRSCLEKLYLIQKAVVTKCEDS